MALSFPSARQAQIIRANQRDLFYVGSLREQSENVLRAWLGSRWLSRWDKEVELAAKLIYFGLTTGRATQTLGEEYTRVYPIPFSPTGRLRASLILLSSLPSYLLARWPSFVPADIQMEYPWIRTSLGLVAPTFEILTEINLALFYFGGAYYDPVKRILGVRQITTIRPHPQMRPPSYSFLGVLLSIRLLHRLITALRSYSRTETQSEKARGKQPMQGGAMVDDRPITDFLGPVDPEGEPTRPAEEDERTMLDIRSLTEEEREGRTCTLCLEERTDSTATECGHLFCWSCIVGWAREKAECPLCRQGLNVKKLLPVYNI